MPVQTSRANQRRAKRILSGAGINREDSDDELGIEDLSWEWLYSTENASKHSRIIGAQYGKFKCMLGDCVLLKAEGYKEAWVAILCEFLEEEEEGEKMANFMWFSSAKEIRNKDKKRSDALSHELYITPAFDVNPLTSINGSAKIMSLGRFRNLFPQDSVPLKSVDSGKVFVCRRGCNVRTATYTDEFVWEDLYHGVDDLDGLIERVRNGTKATRNKKRKADDDAVDWRDSDDISVQPTTPNKKQKNKPFGTPMSKAKTTPQRAWQLSTPTHKRISVKKPLDFTPLGTRILSPHHVSSPFQIARMRLHVSMVPQTLPCREEAFSQVYSHLETAISDGSGSCIYISGTPGTGKTATVREVVSQLHSAVKAEELDDFIFVEINGMKVTDPTQAYSLLWEALQGDRVSPSHALGLLEREFTQPSPRRVPCVVLMDELDQLVTKSQSVMYNFFNWPGLRHSRLIVLAVANTMDLPERTLSNKISSRLGLTRITFPGYTHDQLMEIIQSRLEGVPGGLIDPDAIQFASRKVAAVSGDARRALDICRRAVEIAEGEGQTQEHQGTTPTKSGKGKAAESVSRNGTGYVVINTIKQAIAEATSSPLQHHLKSLSLGSKTLLAALIARLRRTGIAESSLAETMEEMKRLCQVVDNSSLQKFLLTLSSSVESHDGAGMECMSLSPRVLAIEPVATELLEAGVISLEPRGERTSKIRFNISEDEIKLALKDDLEGRSLGLA